MQKINKQNLFNRLFVSFSPAAAGLIFFCVLSLIGAANVFAQTNEGFEAGGKTSYAAASVTLSSGSWYLDDALVGNLSGDVKIGTYSARVRNSGKVRMNFNVSNAGTVAVSHALYGADGSSSWELWQSADGGTNWAKVGSTVTTSSTTLSTAYFTVNSGSAVRFEIRKTSGGTNRINLEDISISNNPNSSSVHLTMGNPSNAATDTNYPANYLMVKDQYALSYARDNGTPNWVAWHLDTSWLGTTPRQDDFRGDSTLPSGWYKVVSTSYTGSGYDRGHMCPSADRTLTVADNSSTFLMTNMVPQTADNNRITWEGLEAYARDLAIDDGSELYIISGVYGNAGWINSNRVLVPTYTWKVIVVLPSGTNDVSRVTGSTRTIAVWVPNQTGINSDWKTYRVSVDYVELMTGYDFFTNVTDATEAAIESVTDNL
ncbi:MAG TPA: DNA/RNA non-specific endonuclease [Pyrinomonadaceae bacterium]|nr:DNA/RNA non-specific endonuclease [Pyrinomonadaceae bacterium]